jgi:hypothetical protein
MTWNPSDLALAAFVLLLGALLTEAYLTCRDWCRRWRERRHLAPCLTPRPLPVVRRPPQGADDQSPYGRGTSLSQ